MKPHGKPPPTSESAKKEMLTQSLPVKYRPKILQHLIGQPAATMQINGMFNTGRIPSTIIFTGPPGTGKTTTARLLARYINCKNLVKTKTSWKPCGECSTCLAGDNTADVTEINAADTRGIDGMRDLVAASKNSAFGGGKRIYIIDEFHALTSQSLSMLLKPLEEPSPNTVWMLCSMSTDKIPQAILSRGLRIDLKPLTPEILVPRLQQIAEKEGVSIKDIPGGEKTLKLICELTSCHPRAAISNLDSLLLSISGGKDIDSKTVLNIFLSTTDADIEKAGVQLIASVMKNDLKYIVKIVRELNQSRNLLNKAKWTILNLIDNEIGIAKYKSYGARLFEKVAKDNELKPTLKALLDIQLKFCRVEQNFMTSNIDEDILLITGLI